MKKTLLVTALAAVLIFAFASAAMAEHAPSNYSTWKTTGANAAPLPATPHTGYTLTSVKCNVCHSVHRSAVSGQTIRNQVNGAFITAGAADTQMLLRSSVAESCKYCHIDTSIGGVRLWNGNSANWGDPGPFSGGYAHNHTSCTECHAVHGAETYKGAAAPKILKYSVENLTRAQSSGSLGPWGINPNVPGNVAAHTYTDPVTGLAVVTGVQDEIFTEAAGLVAAGNQAQFSDLAGVIEGDAAKTVHDAVGADMKDLQVGAFCTQCHPTYASGSEFVTNLDQDSSLFGGTYGAWTLSGVNPNAGTWMAKGHPVTKATNDFFAAGMTIATGKTVAWSDANTCRKCHDAGTSDAGAGTVVYSSWPHVTPGYYRFMGAGASVAEYSAALSKNPITGQPGIAAGAQIQLTTGLPLPNEAAVVALNLPGMNIRSDDPNAPQTASVIGRDGLCLKCHVEGNGLGMEGVGKSY